jgi:hypothetical protein
MSCCGSGGAELELIGDDDNPPKAGCVAITASGARGFEGSFNELDSGTVPSAHPALSAAQAATSKIVSQAVTISKVASLISFKADLLRTCYEGRRSAALGCRARGVA